MVRGIGRDLVHLLLKEAGSGGGRRRAYCSNNISNAIIINNTLSEILACPLSKQPLRAYQCEHEESKKSLISDYLGVSYPIVDGIPCLVPKDGKLLAEDTHHQNLLSTR